jgi:hypothetical protein
MATSPYGDIPGLETDIRQTLDEPMLRRLVKAGQDGRLLAVNTSNLDFAEMHAWDVVAEAERARLPHLARFLGHPGRVPTARDRRQPLRRRRDDRQHSLWRAYRE